MIVEHIERLAFPTDSGDDKCIVERLQDGTIRFCWSSDYSTFVVFSAAEWADIVTAFSAAPEAEVQP